MDMETQRKTPRDDTETEKTQQGEGQHVEVGVEAGVMHPPPGDPKACLPGRNQKRHPSMLPPRLQQQQGPANTSISDFWPPAP